MAVAAPMLQTAVELQMMMTPTLVLQNRGGTISFAKRLPIVRRKRCYSHPVVLVRFESE